MRRGPARLACCLGALSALLFCTAAGAAEGPRIINGTPASQGEYPAQGFLELDTSDGSYVCGGTLISNRYFLTAAHCATDIDPVTHKETTTPLAASAFQVTLGKVSKNDFVPSDRYAVAQNMVDPAFAYIGPGGDIPTNDVALLRLATPAPPSLEPSRMVETGETGLWSPGKTATIIGWGTTEQGGLSDDLLEAPVPMQSDAGCTNAWGSSFSASTMVCAGGGDTDSCGGDSGGPLLVSDGAFLVLAGLTSWGANDCATPNLPGVYTRLGDSALNAFVRGKVPMARATASDATPDTGQAVTFSVTATHPGIPDFTGLAWDFDSDGVADATGASPTHAYPASGNFIARVTATGSGADTAVAKVAVRVSQPPPVATPTPAPVPVVTGPPATEPTPRAQLATILALGKPKASRRGRFNLRISFAQDAPAGTAVIEVFKGRKKIGSARVGVRRGSSRQVTVKLTKAGRKLLRKSKSKRLKVKVQVRVKRQVLRSKTLTIRR
jgi:hypothetical protein